MRKERDWPVPGRGRQSSVFSVSRCLLASGTSGLGNCLWEGCGSGPLVLVSTRAPLQDLMCMGYGGVTGERGRGRVSKGPCRVGGLIGDERWGRAARAGRGYHPKCQKGGRK